MDFRERHGYTRTLTELFAPESTTPLGPAVVYYAHAPAESAAYTGPERLEETAKVIREASGPSGPNDETLGADFWVFFSRTFWPKIETVDFFNGLLRIFETQMMLWTHDIKPARGQ